MCTVLAARKKRRGGWGDDDDDDDDDDGEGERANAACATHRDLAGLCVDDPNARSSAYCTLTTAVCRPSE